MLNRRLWILFAAFFGGFIVLAVRLGRLQLTDADEWRSKLQQFVHRHTVVDSYRGTIVDRNGVILAQDLPSDELAIDYRAMNLDDTWLKKKAVERLRASGEWGHFPDSVTHNRRIQETKEALASQIDAIPDAIARQLASSENLPVDDLINQVIARENKIRERVHALRQDVWLRRFDRSSDADQTTSSTGDSGVDDSSLDALFRQVQLEDEVASHTLWANIPQSVATYFKQHIDEFPGLSVRDNAAHNRRDYPLGEATAHTVGSLRSLDEASYNRHKFDMPNLLNPGDNGDLAGYLPGDRMGETGIERIAEDQLRGIRGVRLLNLSDANTQQVDPRSIDPIPGKAVKLTIDAALQRDIYVALTDPAKALSKNMLKTDDKDLLRGEDGKEHFAAMVIMSLDGQILATISYPSYDPNTLDANRAQLNQDTWRHPLVNRATSAIYHPGSTVKPLLATAALTEHLITVDEIIHCSGHFYPSRPDIFKCDEVHGDVSLVRAISESCNVYFYTVGERLGMDRLVQWYGDYGFGKETGMELPEAPGNLPKPNYRDPEQKKNDSIFMGIGQGPIDVTPLQMANAFATMLRRGISIPPRILADSPAPQTRVFDLSPQILATVRQGMEHVTTDGTAKAIFKSFHLKVAGKTGTAETERFVFDDEGKPVFDPTRPRLDGKGLKQLVERHDDAWFVGYAPENNPQYIVAAVMEWGGHGGAYAAPMVREAFMQLQAHNYLPHTDVP